MLLKLQLPAKICFYQTNADEVFSIIRDTNTASQNVALRNGMVIVEHFVKHYRGLICHITCFSEASLKGLEYL
jgi:RimJ/RimL family protein N-acetyltransferase